MRAMLNKVSEFLFFKMAAIVKGASVVRGQNNQSK